MKIGSKVRILGCLRRNYDGRCAYSEDQLIDGKYLKNTSTGQAWEGIISKIEDDMCLVGGGFWHIRMLEEV